MARHRRKKPIDVASAIVLLALALLDVVLYKNIAADRASAGSPARLYFLPVAQGESALLVLPGGATVMTDAGSDATIVDDLANALPSGAPPYIDLAVISYPQAADYGGFQYLLEHYQVGAFLYDGRADAVHGTEWKQLVTAIAAKKIPLITIGAGDSIRYGGAVKSGAAADEIDIISPDATFARSAEPADTGIVERAVTRTFTALLATDIGTNVESALLARGPAAALLRADILKAPFPGVGNAAGDAFLRAVAARIIVITPGVKGAPSAPTKAMLAHLASSTAAVVASTSDGRFLLYN
ncbi:MAG TPA: hypothetical protein VMA75_02355 [Candidatus Paceibacterota bacterium]|nr:hypothetical protein [Candidatus Paceibacterota bacterium]